MDTELLLKIGSVFGKVETLESQMVDMGNRLDSFLEKHSDANVAFTKDLGEMSGAMKIIQGGFMELIAAAKSAGIELNVQGGEGGKGGEGGDATGSVKTDGGDFAGGNVNKDAD